MIRKIIDYIFGVKKPQIDEELLQKLIESNRYKNSFHKIVLVNGKYAVTGSNTGFYVDLITNAHERNNSNAYFEDCLGTKLEAISAFNYRNPVIIEIKSLETL
jgi:hypothetical protein